jgi:hypothetical protein
MMKNNTKDRLFEVFNKVNGLKLNENVEFNNSTNSEGEGIINDFIHFVDSELGLNGELPEFEYSYDENEASENRSFGGYMFNDNKIRIVLIKRNLADCLRSLAHELVHHKQNLEGRIKSAEDGKTGSEIENEANAKAGILMRNFGKINPKIYEIIFT